MRSIYLAVLLQFVWLAAFAERMPADRIILVGDSTMATRTGYGDALCARFAPNVTCINMAKGGRSTKSYRAEGSWERALETVRANRPFATTYVFIQFGHNDQPGKAERSTTLPEYQGNLTRYVDEVRAAHATPVLVTPLTRRQFKDGKLIRGLEPWAAAMREVARNTQTALLDLHEDSANAVEKMGPAEALTLAQVPPPDDVVAAARAGTTIEAPKPQQRDPSQPLFDYTHLGAKGAQFFAAIVAEEIRRGVPKLAREIESK